jgi:hypothetical protein
MKHLKTFESKSSHEFTIVTFELGEYVKALYIDGVLEFYGDYYHNKITEKISAFIEGVKWAGVSVDVKKINCTDEEINEEVCDMGGIPPKNLEDIK